MNTNFIHIKKWKVKDDYSWTITSYKVLTVPNKIEGNQLKLGSGEMYFNVKNYCLVFLNVIHI